MVSTKMRVTMRLVTACLSSSVMISTLLSAQEPTSSPESLDWQEKILLYPTPGQLAAEQEGRITIYDSLEYSLIDEALDLHFDRMDNMMFIRIHRLPPAGAGPAEVENDGCD